MIYPLILLSIWSPNHAGQTLGAVALRPSQVPVSQPILHLRNFFDARSLAPGDPIFIFAPAITPKFDAAKELAFFPAILRQHPAAPAPVKVVLAKPIVTKPANVKTDAVKRMAAKPMAKPAVAKAEPSRIVPVVAPKPIPIKTAATPLQLKPTELKPSAPKLVATRTAAQKPAPQIQSNVPKTVVESAFVSRVLPSDTGKSQQAAHTVSSLVPTPAAAPNPSSYKLEDIPVTLNMAKAPFRALLDQLMKQTGADLLLLADNAPDITIKVTKHRFIDTLTDMCAMANLSFLKVNSEYVIATDDKLKTAYPVAYAAAYAVSHPVVKVQGPEIVQQTYNTNYCDAQKLADTLGKQFKPEELEMIVAPSAVQQSLGNQDSSSVSGVSSSVLDKDTTKTSRILILRGSRETVDAALSLLKAMDVKAQQVNISVTINDMSVDAEKQLGLAWTFPQVTLTENQPSGIGFGSFTRSPLTFNATMSALQSKGLDKLLASPNITVEDGQRAYILVGQRLEFPVVNSFNQNGTPIFSIDQERVGIYLQVSVWISNDGKVKLDLYPQVSTVSSFINVNGGSYPQIATRECQTTLTVESGHTIVIGGLIHDEEITNLQQVPILSKIPIFGELFTNRTKTKTKDEVIITITPTIDPK